MKKLGVSIFLFMILVALPYGSWWYLEQGMKYRKEAIKDLEVKDDFTKTLEQSDLRSQLLHNTTVLALNDKASKDNILKLYDQYKKSFSFRLISTIDLGIDADNYKYIHQDSVSNLLIQLNSPSFILTDTLGQVRSLYSENPDELRKLIEHIAIILPRKEELDVKMKR
jgi:hypothetical protein